MSTESSKKAHHSLEEMGIIIQLNTRVETYDGEVVKFNDGTNIPTTTLIWAAGVTGSLLRASRSQ